MVFRPERSTAEIVAIAAEARLNNIKLGLNRPDEIHGLGWNYTGGASGVNMADGIKVTMPDGSTVSLTTDIEDQQKVFAIFGWSVEPASSPPSQTFYAQTRFEDDDTGNEWIVRQTGGANTLEIYSNPAMTLRASVSGLYLSASSNPVGGIINLATSDISAWWTQTYVANLDVSLAPLVLNDVDRVIFEVVNNSGGQKILYLKPPVVISYE